MKISVEEVNRLLAFPPSSGVSGRSASESTTSGSNQTASSGAQVDISAYAREIQQVKQVVNQLPDVREDRVRELKAQIENGTYRVSGEDIADLMIRRTLADNTAL